ncbi:MAG: methyltransferase [Myxococcales bacterium]|nr:methyltransferase [Myxococcales bacterium]
MSDRPTELLAAIELAQFTPRVSDAPLLVALAATADKPTLAQLATALGRLPPAAIEPALIAGLSPQHDARFRAAVCDLARRLPAVHADAAVSAFARALRDPQLAVRKAAVRGLSNHDHPAALAALAALAGAPDLGRDAARMLMRALAKVGAVEVLARLRERFPDVPTDVAAVIAGRHAARGVSVAINAAHAFAAGELLAECRDGIAPIAASQYAAMGLRSTVVSSQHLRLQSATSLQAALACRSVVRVGLRLAGPQAARPAQHVMALVGIVGNAYAALRTVTTGPIRYRLTWPGATTSMVHQVAVAVAAMHADMVNDPRGASWNISPLGSQWVAWPTGLPDTRFAWRQGDIPAASHPTVAAALAFLAQPTDTDRIWDPFCGSGSELIECGLLAPTAALIGTDLASAALAVATRNIAAAGLTARTELTLADACAQWPDATLVISNPPHGGRVKANAVSLHEQFFAHVASRLPAGGRLVWIRHANATLASSRLVRGAHFNMSLAGQAMVLERWDAR